MEVTISAIIGDLAVRRSISFLMDKCMNRAAPTEEGRLDSLQRLLLRVRVIVEEAEERRIRNQSMLQQLNILKKEMYRGSYTLDMFRRRAHGGEDAKDHGGEDAAEHPKLASIAMDMAMEFEGRFLAANISSGPLRSNPKPRLWSLALATRREFKQKNIFMYGADKV